MNTVVIIEVWDVEGRYERVVFEDEDDAIYFQEMKLSDPKVESTELSYEEVK